MSICVSSSRVLLTPQRVNLMGLPPSRNAIKGRIAFQMDKLSADKMSHELIVANVCAVQLIAASEKKTDQVDAEMLARLARVDPNLLSPNLHSEIQRILREGVFPVTARFFKALEAE